ncbi:MAG: PIG-L family deacetylase [Chloroflexi bacterium]|nr:PIG-L family deacetylase [Chloroflexota bacterium]
MMTLPAPESQPRVLGVYAHPDDEAFCTGGTFARYAAAGCEVMVVSATRGQAGQIRCAHLATRDTLGQVREAELRLACARLGVKDVECWDYLDGMLAEIDADELAARVARMVRAYQPDVVFTFGSDGAYGHPDHIAISRAATAACSSSGGSVSALPRLYHAVFPPRRRRLRDHLVRWLSETGPDFRGDPEFVHGLLLLAEEASALRYVDDHHEVKWFPSGFRIVEQGEPATALYLLLAGQADVVREDAQGRRDLVSRLQPGQFFGEHGIAWQKPRTAHVIAAEGATCLVLRPRQPTLFEARGAGAHPPSVGTHADSAGDDDGAAIRLEVDDFLHAKLQALAAYRSQFPIEPDMLPESIFRDLFGVEYFLPVQSLSQVDASEATGVSHAGAASECATPFALVA